MDRITAPMEGMQPTFHSFRFMCASFYFPYRIANTLSEKRTHYGMIRGGLYSRQLDLVSKLATPILIESCKMHVANV
jgi:hypothetical protein